ncbi:MAG: ATP synthase F1 subunit delta [Lachnospiraceae bacterium]|nr:ATP synthase F1 subunit delta [Lachnospiraceae bacterium]
MAKLIGKTYGDALYETAIEKNTLDQLTEEVAFAAQSFKENPAFMDLLTHPQIVREEKIACLEKVFKGRVSDDLVGLMVVTIEKDRQKDLPEIFDYFISRAKEEKGIGLATVTSATELRKEQRDRIEKKLIETTPYQTFEMTYEVDPSLIGGMVIRIGDRVADSSIRTQLEKLERELQTIKL